jgi:hypothetical protein
MRNLTARHARDLICSFAMCAAWTLALVAGFTLPAEAKTFKEMFPGTDITNDKARAIVEAMDYQQGVVPLGATCRSSGL